MAQRSSVLKRIEAHTRRSDCLSLVVGGPLGFPSSKASLHGVRGCSIEWFSSADSLGTIAAIFCYDERIALVSPLRLAAMHRESRSARSQAVP
jgi:hypothetical protein